VFRVQNLWYDSRFPELGSMMRELLKPIWRFKKSKLKVYLADAVMKDPEKRNTNLTDLRRKKKQTSVLFFTLFQDQ
jgi:hypothetical protein